MAGYVAPQTGGIFAGTVYLVSGTTGSVTYNAVVYTIGQQFTGVDGVRNYTATGDAFAEPIAAIRSLDLEYDLAPGDKTFNETLAVRSINVEQNLAPNEKTYDQTLAIRSLNVEYIQDQVTQIVTETNRRLSLRMEYTDGNIPTPTIINGGTLTGLIQQAISAGQIALFRKENNPTGTWTNETSGTADRFIKYESNITDSNLIRQLGFNIEIIQETATNFRFRVRPLNITTFDITLTGQPAEMGISGANVFTRSYTGVFDSMSELVVQGNVGTTFQRITIKLTP
ncbi:MAG TPA: hypothetical protein VFV37_10905 [Luteibaculaceae bacterium]|nr:hypothetical protein [Luteibaculaceae bacterium]